VFSLRCGSNVDDTNDRPCVQRLHYLHHLTFRVARKGNANGASLRGRLRKP
jgi:hypothetical protein